VLDGSMTTRPKALHFWEFQAGGKSARGEPYIDPELQTGTTPLVKKMGGKATRDFTNFRHPVIVEGDYLGTRSIIEGDSKLIIHESKQGEPKIELFDLKADPAEKTNLADQQPQLVKSLQTQLREWQGSVLQSLVGSDYHR
jgi:arylsulfatase A-like enzyme